MTTRDDKNHRAVAPLLPWYINKTLSAAESHNVETHLATCADCRKELAALTALESAVIGSNEELPAPPADLMDRVMSRVDQYERGRARAGRASMWERLAGFGFTLPRLAMAQLAAIVLLAGALGITGERAVHFRSVSVQEKERADVNQAALAQEREKFQALAQTCPELSKDFARIKVAFRDEASEKQIRELLLEIGGSISSGPSAQNFCTVSVRIPEDARMNEVVENAVARLRRNQQVVSFAEVLP
ncbi:MAG TPA: zf-HC2 domain-containing protein [Blastocatellia bacterium]|nr:zf-HC2 domain-containing protein [Blastocatellia bacterium]